MNPTRNDEQPPAEAEHADQASTADERQSAPLPAGELAGVLEAALLAAGQPLNLNQLNALFDEDEQPGHGRLREALALLDAELEGRAVELTEVAGGYRLQIRARLMPRISRLWAEKPPRYSRALLETLAIIAYRQPITRGEIEQIRGVSLSANILKTLNEREWVKAVGHRDIPGRPELLGTTAAFLDYFGLKGLDDLPTLAEIRDLDNIEPELALNDPEHDAPQATGKDPQDVKPQDAEQDTQDRDAIPEQQNRIEQEREQHVRLESDPPADREDQHDPEHAGIERREAPGDDGERGSTPGQTDRSARDLETEARQDPADEQE